MGYRREGGEEEKEEVRYGLGEREKFHITFYTCTNSQKNLMRKERKSKIKDVEKTVVHTIPANPIERRGAGR